MRDSNTPVRRPKRTDAPTAHRRTWPRVVVFYLITMVGAGLLGLLQPALGIDPVIIEIVQFAPTLGVLVVAALWWRPTQELLSRRRTGAPRPVRAIALLATPVLIMASCVATYAVLGHDVRYTAPSTLGEPFAAIVVAQFVGACGEEFGWRSFLQPLLRARMGVLSSSVLVGLLWGAWHVQVFTYAPVYAGAFLAMAVGLSVVLGVALDGVGRARLPLAGGFHALINLGMLLLLNEESGAVAPMLVLAVSTLVAAALWLAFRPATMQPARDVNVSGR